jgi:DNA polymerase III alpha subunit
MAFVQVEDLHASAEMVCFADLYREAAPWLEGEQALLVAARVDRSREEMSLVAEAIEPLEAVLARQVEAIRLESSAVAWDAERLRDFRALAEAHPGGARVRFRLRLGDGSIAELSSSIGLCWNEEVKQALRGWFGADGVHLRCRPWRPERGPSKTREERRRHAA